MPSNRELFLRHVGQTSEMPMLVEIERAEGVYMFGPNGERYLDLISGIGVSSVGHGAPEVVQAVQAQAAQYMHTMVYGEFVLSPQVQLAAKLVEVLDSDLDNVYFVNSGSEATEGALKLAKKYTGRSELVAFHDSYHGSTHGALSVTGSPALKEGYGPFLPGVKFLTFNDVAQLGQITEATAGVIVEFVRGEAGFELPAEGYLEALRARCTEVGALLVVDEIQTGYGRTGALFAHQKYGVAPDILLLAKGMGGGMPIGAFVSRKEVMHVLTNDPVLGHITTFGGHPVNCAAGLATLNKILDEDLVGKMPAKTAVIKAVLQHADILELRGVGMMWAVEMGSFERVLEVIKYCTENGVITDWFLHCETAIRVAPPLVITEEELREGLMVLVAGIEATKKQHR